MWLQIASGSACRILLMLTGLQFARAATVPSGDQHTNGTPIKLGCLGGDSAASAHGFGQRGIEAHRCYGDLRLAHGGGLLAHLAVALLAAGSVSGARHGSAPCGAVDHLPRRPRSISRHGWSTYLAVG